MHGKLVYIFTVYKETNDGKNFFKGKKKDDSSDEDLVKKDKKKKYLCFATKNDKSYIYYVKKLKSDKFELSESWTADDIKAIEDVNVPLKLILGYNVAFNIW